MSSFLKTSQCARWQVPSLVVETAPLWLGPLQLSFTENWNPFGLEQQSLVAQSDLFWVPPRGFVFSAARWCEELGGSHAQ